MSFSIFSRLFSDNSIFVPGTLVIIIGVLGIFLIISGFFIPKIKSRARMVTEVFFMKEFRRLWDKLKPFTKNPIILRLNRSLIKVLVLYIHDETSLSFLSRLLVLLTVSVGAGFGIWLGSFGNTWCVNIVLFIAGALLPYYVVTLAGDIIRLRFNKGIPLFFDEFRSAFIRNGRIVPSLRESCYMVDKSLGRVIRKNIDSRNPLDGLKKLKDNFDNIWFGIFVSMLENYKNNGGELIVQLYRLNRSITRMNNLEKKKNKRLLLYELFAVGATAAGIPTCIYINSMILGNGYYLNDYESNSVILRVILYCLGALAVTRALRSL